MPFLDSSQTSSLNRLIAVRFHCNSTETKSLLNLVMCNSSARSSLRYDLDRVISSNSNNSILGSDRFAGKHLHTKLPSQVYHVFYSSASSDSIIYILAILCIYFLLFSLLIYANWNTFNQYGYRKRRRSNRNKRKLLSSAAAAFSDSNRPIGAFDSVVCLTEAEASLASTRGSNSSDGENISSKNSGDKLANEPRDTKTTTTVIVANDNPSRLIHI